MQQRFGRRRAAGTIAALALAPPLLVAGCGESGPNGTYVNQFDPNDKVEFLSSTRARITAIAGKPLGVWERGGRAQTEFGRAMQDARMALTRFEMVEVT